MSILGNLFPPLLDISFGGPEKAPKEARLYIQLGEYLISARKSYPGHPCPEHKLYLLARNIIELSEDPLQEEMLEMLDLLIEKTTPEEPE